MNRQAKRCATWTSITFTAGLCAGGAFKAALDALQARQGWHMGGEVLVLLVLLALPLVWLWGAKINQINVDETIRDNAKKVMAGGWLQWK